MNFDDEIYIYDKFKSPLEQPYLKVIQDAFSDCELIDGPYMYPMDTISKLGCITYLINADNNRKFVHIDEKTYSISGIVEEIKDKDRIIYII